MLAPPVTDSVLDYRTQEGVLPAELEFYQNYDWCLNPYPTVSEMICHLRSELDRLTIVSNGWQIGEVATNIFLCSCGLLNCTDEYQRGPALRLPKRVAGTFVGRSLSRFMETISDKPLSRRRVARWRERWLVSLNDFLFLIVGQQPVEATRLAEAGRGLMLLLQLPLPSRLQTQRVAVANPFSRLDLTQKDILALGESFVSQFPDRTQPILLVGLRTSGSYFAPVLRAFFEAEGYERVALMTIEPNKGAGRQERKELQRFAARGYWALIVDDPPHTSRTMLAALDIVTQMGFSSNRVKFVAPTHPAKTSWFKMFPDDSVITLPPERWHKRALLKPKSVEHRLSEYFRNRNFAHVSIAASRRADEFNVGLQSTASDKRSERLKRVFQVQLVSHDGEKQTKYVLAKSVGWGWLSYHAFLIGHRLSGHVPPILGLRDGILYMEWIPQPIAPADTRNQLLDASACYVAARVHRLKLTGSVAGMDLKRHNYGSQLLETALSRAYGWFLPDRLMRSRVGRRVRMGQCPCPTLIDGNMHRREWIGGANGPLKTDYEHHGMGKTALNITDPAYDLADTILNLALSVEEERKLIEKYIAETGDTAIEQRLFMHKLLAGLWSMSQTQAQLFDSPRGGDAQRNYHRRFMNAWNFLTVQTARHCGSLCQPRANLTWRSPLVALDIDGVIDRRLFGFPCTTSAGIEAISLLSAHAFCVVLNTARSAAEVKEYCEAYSLAGGVAEYGGYLWDAVNQREQVLISAEAERQLVELKGVLQGIPGVFLDERHQYSIRAFTYRDKPSGMIQSLIGSVHACSIGDGALAPISTHIVHQLLADRQLDQLAFHHTMIDTTITAKEVNKGTGLTALRDWVLTDAAETIAVGDSEPDLAMFRVATRSFAPGNTSCRRQAQLLGCQIASHRDQQGLLEIVHKIVHPDGGHCERCDHGGISAQRGDSLFLSVLQAADQSWISNLLRAISYPTAFRSFFR
jgi:hydroxymethylpyrimidine pyrophosphatase-like HAD family hydrolase